MEGGLQKEIQLISEKIKEKVRQLKKLRDDKTIFHDKKEYDMLNEEIWELSKKKFLLMAEANENLRTYKGLICTVGFSKEPVILSIIVNQPKAVYFILSNETLKQLDYIVEETELKPSQYKYSIIPSESPLEAYNAMRKALKFLNDTNDISEKDIALDPTGGTKLMSIGCGIGASVFKLDLLYVSYKRYDPELRRPEPGTERLLRMPRPFNLRKKELNIDVIVNDPELFWELGVFISYCTKDSEYFHISEVASKLEQYPEIDKVFYWEEHSGDNIVRFMEEYIGRSRIFLLFCSENACKSEAVKSEWEAAFQLRKEGKLKIIPVHYNREHIPLMLRSYLDVEFITDDIDRFVTNLYNEILRKLEE